MTLDAEHAANEPLVTENDMVQRIRMLLAPACVPGRLWVLILDEHGYQSPVMVPIDDCPDLPDPAHVDTLTSTLRIVVDDTFGGVGQVIFVLERLGSLGTTTIDHCWAAALSGACHRASLPLAGTFLLSPGGVSPITP